jgi:hypothetical protein
VVSHVHLREGSAAGSTRGLAWGVAVRGAAVGRAGWVAQGAAGTRTVEGVDLEFNTGGGMAGSVCGAGCPTGALCVGAVADTDKGFREGLRTNAGQT